MRRRTLVNGAVVSTVLLAAVGVGVAVASAATSTPSTSTTASASASPSPTISTTVSSKPTASTSPSASTSSSSSSGDGSECAEVFLVKSPAGDSVGKLCTAVTSSGTTVSGVTVTYTASSSCTGSLMLRVSGADQKGAEFGVVKTVSCSSGTATASFDPVSEVASGTDICGTLLSDTYTAAQACVAVS